MTKTTLLTKELIYLRKASNLSQPLKNRLHKKSHERSIPLLGLAFEIYFCRLLKQSTSVLRQIQMATATTTISGSRKLPRTDKTRDF